MESIRFTEQLLVFRTKEPENKVTAMASNLEHEDLLSTSLRLFLASRLLTRAKLILA